MKDEFRFTIRDDDINFFTNAKKLAEFYEPLFRICKPTMCITPFAGERYKRIVDKEGELNTRDERLEFTKELMNNRKVYPIEDNPDLVSLLKKWISEDQIGVALHGVTHNPTPNGYECEVPEEYKSLLEAKLYLEKLLETKFKSFSAPNNSVNKAWKKKLGGLGMNLVLSYGSRPSEVSYYGVKSINSMFKLYFHYLIHGKEIFYPKVLNYSSISELASFPQGLNTKFDSFVKNVEFAKKNCGVFVLAIHSYAFLKHPYMLDQFNEMCLFLSKKGKGVSLDDLFIK